MATRRKTSKKTPAKRRTGPAEREAHTEVVRRPAGRALAPFEEMDRLFESVFGRGLLRPLRWEWPSLAELTAPFEIMPRVDVIDRDTEVVIRAEVPGVEKKDLDVSLSEHAVTIKGTTSHEEREEEGHFFRAELSRGTFARTVPLPAEVDSAKAKAKFKDGVLTLTIPKVVGSRRRSIPVE